MTVLLVFPPGWTLCTGSPHAALPLLAASLRRAGIDVSVRDLNIEWSSARAMRITAGTACAATISGDLESLNEPYFAIEDALQRVAAEFQGDWNAQLGFHYADRPELSSSRLRASTRRRSPFDAQLDAVVESIADDPKSLVAVSVTASYQLVIAVQLAQRLRDAGFEGHIVFGGNTISRLEQELARPWLFDLVDALISFQGENALVDLCRAISSGRPLEGIPGITWRDQAGIVRRNVVAPSPLPDSLATADFSGLPLRDYWGVDYLCIVAARGCYYGKCNFCAIPFGWGSDGFAGVRSAEKTWTDMIALNERHGVTRFKFVDEALSPHFMRQLAALAVRAGSPFEWEGYTRLEASWESEQFVRDVARGGFRKGYFGLELIPSDERSRLNKRDHANPEELLAMCDAHGVRTHLFCMFGYPGTGEKEAAETTEFILRHRGRIDTADIFPWTLAKHTRVDSVSAVQREEDDLALEFDHAASGPGILTAQQVQELAAKHEEVLWDEAPRLLHPTYRLVSPWSYNPEQRRIRTAARNSSQGQPIAY